MVSAISYIHNIKGYNNPAEAFVIKKLLRSTKLTTHCDKREPITIPILTSLLEALPKVTRNSKLLRLFRAIFLVAFYGLFRIGELTFTKKGIHNLISKRNVKFCKNNQTQTCAIITLHSYKHSLGQKAKIALKQQPISSLCPVRALKRYIQHDHNAKDHLFVLPCGSPITSTFFRQVLRKCVHICGLDPSTYTAHSFRIGGATHAFSQGLSTAQIKHLGRWKSSAYLKYIRPNDTTS